MLFSYIANARVDAVVGGIDGSSRAACHENTNHAPHVGASRARCAQVHSYAYTSPTPSMFETLFLERWWTYVVERWIPLWVAPNALTCGGLALVACAYGLLWMTSPGLAHDAPGVVYALVAFLMFSYQTLDGCDGKQARRTRSGSPLGEVVDHGCDAACTCVYGIILCDIVGIGYDASALNRAICVGVLTMGRVFFAVDTVSSTYTGRLPVNWFDVQEMQICLQVFMVVIAFTGIEFMYDITAHVPYLGTQPLAYVLVGASILSGLQVRSTTAYRTLVANPVKPPHWPAHRSPMAIVSYCAVNELFHGVCLFYAKNLALAHAASTMLFAESETRIMSIRVSDPNFPLTNWLSLAIMACTTLVPEGDVFTSGILIGAALFLLLNRAASLSAQITGCLGIHSNIFVLRPKQD